MKRIAVALLLAGPVLGLSVPAFAVDNLFPGNMFPDENSKPLFPDFNASQPVKINKAGKQDPEAAKKAYQETIARDDEQMRKEMQKVASWLQEFCLRNQNRFPGVYEGS